MKKKTCLWVDDDHSTWPAIEQELLEQFELETCDNYIDACRQLEARDFDILLLDIIIPKGSKWPSVDPYLGLALAEMVLKRNKPVAGIVFFSIVDPVVISDGISALRTKANGKGIPIEFFPKTLAALSVSYLIDKLLTVTDKSSTAEGK